MGVGESSLKSAALKDLQERFEGVEYMLVDEMSIVGQDLLGLMSFRGRQAVAGRTPDGNDGRERGFLAASASSSSEIPCSYLLLVLRRCGVTDRRQRGTPPRGA